MTLTQAGFVLITARWYRASEQAFRTGIWFCFNGVAQIVGGALAYGVSRGFEENSHIHFSSWKALFLITGLATSVYGVALFFFLPESPILAPWLNEEEKHVAIERLRGNQQGVGTKVFKWYQFREAFTDIRVSGAYDSVAIHDRLMLQDADISNIPFSGDCRYSLRRHHRILHPTDRRHGL